MDIMARNGFQKESLSALVPGITGETISMDMLIIISTIGRATVDLCRHVANIPQSIVRSFTARQCMIRMGMKRHADTDSILRRRDRNMSIPELILR